MTERVDQGERIPFRHSIQLKFALTYIVIIAAVLILLNTYPVLVSQDLVFRSKANMLHSQASVIANTIAQTEKLSAETVRGYIEPLDYMGQYRVLVTDQFGLILYDSDDLRATEGRYAMLSEVVAALRGYDVAASEYREAAFHSRAAVPVIYRTSPSAASTFMSMTPSRPSSCWTSSRTCAPSPWWSAWWCFS